MTRRTHGHSPARRARRSFWVLLVVAVLATGSLSSAINAEPGAVTGLWVGASGLVLIAALALAARVMVALSQARRRSLAGPTGAGRRP